MPGVATLADIEAIESVPLAERDLPTSTYEAVARSAARWPEEPALLFFLRGTAFRQTVTYTYRDLLARITQTANLFTQLGLAQDQVVSYLLPNLPQTYFTLLGGEAAGIANPLNPLLEPAVLADIMRAAETRILVTLAPFPATDLWQKVAAIVDEVPTLHTILRVDLAQFLSGWQRWLVKALRWRQPRLAVRAQVLDFDAALAAQPADQLRHGRRIQPNDVASYFHTGGTTGTPKLAIHTHFNEIFDTWCGAQAIGARPGERVFCGLPLFHNYGALVTGVGTWQAGITVVLGTPQGYRGEGVLSNFWRIVEHYRLTSFAGVPTVFSALLQVPIGDSDISSLEGATCGAAPMPVELYKQFEATTGIQILEGYGLTEGTSVCSVAPREGEVRVGSIGLRLPYQELRVALVEDGRWVRWCEPDEVGVVLTRGPHVFPGYKDPHANRSAFVDSGDGGGLWLNTGDLGRQDRAGYFWLTGRQKELIIRGGHNIDPKQIEEPLHEHPAVALAAAVGRPDPRVGELPVVYVQLKPQAQATAEELLEFARQRIGERAAIPRLIKIVPELPLTAVGKIHKLTLIYDQIDAAYTEALQGVAGVAELHIQVEGHRQLGAQAHIHVTPRPAGDPAALEAAIRQALAAYTIPYTLKIGQADVS